MINCFTLDYVGREDNDGFEYIKKYFKYMNSSAVLAEPLSKKVEYFLEANLRSKLKERKKSYYSWYYNSSGCSFIDCAIGYYVSYEPDSDYGSRVNIGLTEAFIKDSNGKLYDAISYIDQTAKFDDIVEELFKQTKSIEEKWLVYSLLISYYFVVGDYNNFEKYILEAIKETSNVVNKKVSSYIFFIRNPNELHWYDKQDDNHLIVEKLKIWLQYALCSNKIENTSKSYLSTSIMTQIYNEISTLYKRFYLEDKNTLQMYQVISKIYPMKTTIDSLGRDNSLNVYIRGSKVTDEEYLDLLECSPARLNNSIASFNEYYDGKRFKSILEDESKRERLFEIIRTYLVNEFGKKRSNSILRKFLKSFSSILTYCNATSEMMEFISGVPENISGEVLKQMVAD